MEADNIKINTVKLEDSKTYMIIGTVDLKNIKYFILSELGNTENYQVRKVTENNTLERLSSRFEFYDVLEDFKEKMEGCLI